MVELTARHAVATLGEPRTGGDTGDGGAATAIPMPPPELSLLVGGGDDFVAVGRALHDVLVSHTGLRPDEAVLEIGCGVGRVARVLCESLRPPGRYDGIDVHGPHIDWCAAEISRRHPHFRFFHADVRNAAYNPSGASAAAGYRMPFDDASYDLVFLASVFTHMTEGDVQCYLHEIRRLLRPGGRVFATFFLLNAQSEHAVEAGATRLSFDHRAPRFWAHSEACPEVAIAFPEPVVQRLFLNAGLRVRGVEYGDWIGSGPALTYQDVVLASPA